MAELRAAARTAASLQDFSAARPDARGGFGVGGGVAVSGFERQQMFSALILLVIALFVAGGFPPAARWRRELRIAAIVAFCAALGWALIEIGLVDDGHTLKPSLLN